MLQQLSRHPAVTSCLHTFVFLMHASFLVRIYICNKYEKAEHSPSQSCFTLHAKTNEASSDERAAVMKKNNFIFTAVKRHVHNKLNITQIGFQFTFISHWALFNTTHLDFKNLLKYITTWLYHTVDNAFSCQYRIMSMIIRTNSN